MVVPVTSWPTSPLPPDLQQQRLDELLKPPPPCLLRLRPYRLGIALRLSSCPYRLGIAFGLAPLAQAFRSQLIASLSPLNGPSFLPEERSRSPGGGLPAPLDVEQVTPPVFRVLDEVIAQHKPTLCGPAAHRVGRDTQKRRQLRRPQPFSSGWLLLDLLLLVALVVDLQQLLLLLDDRLPNVDIRLLLDDDRHLLDIRLLLLLDGRHLLGIRLPNVDNGLPLPLHLLIEEPAIAQRMGRQQLLIQWRHTGQHRLTQKAGGPAAGSDHSRRQGQPQQPCRLSRQRCTLSQGHRCCRRC